MNLEQNYITSLEVAEMMEIEHYKIIRKLEGDKDRKGFIQVLTDSQMGVSDYFTESTYTDASGKTNKCYNITRLGCDFLANKFTGEKGIIFTAKYVKRFRDMEDTLKVPMTTTGQIQLLAQGHVELEQRVISLDTDFQNFKTEMPLLAVDTERITYAKNKVVTKLMGGKKSNAYRNGSLRSKVYSDLSGQLKREFGVSTYRAIKRNQTDLAIEMIDKYVLPTYLQEQVDFENSQMNL